MFSFFFLQLETERARHTETKERLAKSEAWTTQRQKRIEELEALVKKLEATIAEQTQRIRTLTNDRPSPRDVTEIVKNEQVLFAIRRSSLLFLHVSHVASDVQLLEKRAALELHNRELREQLQVHSHTVSSLQEQLSSHAQSRSQLEKENDELRAHIAAIEQQALETATELSALRRTRISESDQVQLVHTHCLPISFSLLSQSHGPVYSFRFFFTARGAIARSHCSSARSRCSRQVADSRKREAREQVQGLSEGVRRAFHEARRGAHGTTTQG